MVALNQAAAIFNNMAHDILSRGLGFFELNTGDDGFFAAAAGKADSPYAQNLATVDVLEPQGQALAGISAHINAHGGGVITVNPSPNNIPALKKWLEDLAGQGVALVPVSAVADPDIERN